MSHTQGKLIAERIPATFNPKMDGFQLVGATPDGNDLMTVALCTVNDADEANARRLVACWNACEGISTEELESERSSSTGWARTASKLLKATTERDALRAVNAELVEALEGLDEAYCRSGSPLDRAARNEDRRRLIAARAALAKAKELKGTL